METLALCDRITVLDWTNDGGLQDRYKAWRKKVEGLCQVMEAGDQKAKLICQMVSYWSGKDGQQAIDTWKAHPDTENADKTKWRKVLEAVQAELKPKSSNLCAAMEYKVLQ